MRLGEPWAMMVLGGGLGSPWLERFRDPEGLSQALVTTGISLVARLLLCTAGRAPPQSLTLPLSASAQPSLSASVCFAQGGRPAAWDLLLVLANSATGSLTRPSEARDLAVGVSGSPAWALP